MRVEARVVLELAHGMKYGIPVPSRVEPYFHDLVEQLMDAAAASVTTDITKPDVVREQIAQYLVGLGVSHGMAMTIISWYWNSNRILLVRLGGGVEWSSRGRITRSF